MCYNEVLPIHALGPILKGRKLYLCLLFISSKVKLFGFQIKGLGYIAGFLCTLAGGITISTLAGITKPSPVWEKSI